MKRKTRTTLTAGMLLMPGLLVAQTAAKVAPPGKATPERTASPQIFIKFADKFMKHKGELKTVGMLGGSPVFKNGRGEYFTVEGSTGNLKFHTAESLGFIKIGDLKGRSAGAGMFIKFDGIKGEQRVSILGVDAQGRVVQENARGEKFVLGPNGDMQFVK